MLHCHLRPWRRLVHFHCLRPTPPPLASQWGRRYASSGGSIDSESANLSKPYRKSEAILFRSPISATTESLLDSITPFSVGELGHSQDRAYAACICFTPCFAHRIAYDAQFLPRVVNRLYGNLCEQTDDSFTLQTIVAVVDRIPRPSETPVGLNQAEETYHRAAHPPVNDNGHEGMAYFAGTLRDLDLEWTCQPLPHAQPKSITFRPFYTTASAANRKVFSVQVPLANTIFHAGQDHVLDIVEWSRPKNERLLVQVTSTPASSAGLQITMIVRHSNGRPRPSSLSVPLVPLTLPHRIEAAMGNVVRRIAAFIPGHVDPVPASQELELQVDQYFKVRNQSPSTLSVWALVMPEDVRGDNLETPTPSDTWQADPQVYNTRLLRLLAGGARLHRVLSGGGGWGSKAGLISLDPQSDFGMRLANDIDDEWPDGEINASGLPVKMLGNAAKVGDYIQYFVARADGEGETVAEPFSILSSVEIGTIPSTVDSLPSLQHTGETLNPWELDTAEVIPNHFGVLSERGVSLNFGSTVSKVDVPYSRLSCVRLQQSQQVYIERMLKIIRGMVKNGYRKSRKRNVLNHTENRENSIGSLTFSDQIIDLALDQFMSEKRLEALEDSQFPASVPRPPKSSDAFERMTYLRISLEDASNINRVFENISTMAKDREALRLRKEGTSKPLMKAHYTWKEYHIKKHTTFSGPEPPQQELEVKEHFTNDDSLAQASMMISAQDELAETPPTREERLLQRAAVNEKRSQAFSKAEAVIHLRNTSQPMGLRSSQAEQPRAFTEVLTTESTDQFLAVGRDTANIQPLRAGMSTPMNIALQRHPQESETSRFPAFSEHRTLDSVAKETPTKDLDPLQRTEQHVDKKLQTSPLPIFHGAIVRSGDIKWRKFIAPMTIRYHLTGSETNLSELPTPQRDDSLSENFSLSEAEPLRITKVLRVPSRITRVLRVPSRITRVVRVPSRITRVLRVPSRITRVLRVPSRIKKVLRVPSRITKVLTVPRHMTRCHKVDLPAPPRTIRKINLKFLDVKYRIYDANSNVELRDRARRRTLPRSPRGIFTYRMRKREHIRRRLIMKSHPRGLIRYRHYYANSTKRLPRSRTHRRTTPKPLRKRNFRRIIPKVPRIQKYKSLDKTSLVSVSLLRRSRTRNTLVRKVSLLKARKRMTHPQATTWWDNPAQYAWELLQNRRERDKRRKAKLEIVTRLDGKEDAMFRRVHKIANVRGQSGDAAGGDRYSIWQPKTPNLGRDTDSEDGGDALSTLEQTLVVEPERKGRKGRTKIKYKQIYNTVGGDREAVRLAQEVKELLVGF